MTSFIHRSAAADFLRRCADKIDGGNGSRATFHIDAAEADKAINEAVRAAMARHIEAFPHLLKRIRLRGA